MQPKKNQSQSYFEMEFEAWKEAVMGWVPVAMQYEEITQSVVYILFQRFKTKISYDLNQVVIKAAILAGFPKADRATVEKHAQMKKSKGLGTTAERKKVFNDCATIVRRVSRLFMRLKVELYGDTPAALLAEIPAEEAEQTATEVANEIENPSPIIDLVNETALVPAAADEDDEDENGDEQVAGNKKKKNGNLWGGDGDNDRQGKAKEGQPGQDLYETSAEAFEFVKNSLLAVCDADTTFFEPFAGNKKIVSYLKKMGFTKIISRDLYIPDEEKKTYDFFTEPFPEVEGTLVVVTNPPWGKLKLKTLKRLVEKGVPYFCLFKVDILCYVEISDLFIKHGVCVIPIRGQPSFLNNGRNVNAGYCAWFIGGPGIAPGVHMSYESIEDGIDAASTCGLSSLGDNGELDAATNQMGQMDIEALI